jgi:hypothetical protein
MTEYSAIDFLAFFQMSDLSRHSSSNLTGGNQSPANGSLENVNDDAFRLNSPAKGKHLISAAGSGSNTRHDSYWFLATLSSWFDSFDQLVPCVDYVSVTIGLIESYNEIGCFHFRNLRRKSTPWELLPRCSLGADEIEQVIVLVGRMEGSIQTGCPSLWRRLYLPTGTGRLYDRYTQKFDKSSKDRRMRGHFSSSALIPVMIIKTCSSPRATGYERPESQRVLLSWSPLSGRMTDAAEQTAFHLIFFSLKNFSFLFVDIESVVRNGTTIRLI